MNGFQIIVNLAGVALEVTLRVQVTTSVHVCIHTMHVTFVRICLKNHKNNLLITKNTYIIMINTYNVYEIIKRRKC